jgi:glycosyltransferase involved in cell wall biosynthesis
MPDVSVIIPCYNHGRFIHEAIDSVLNQTYQNFEIIVVNDGSTDAQTIDILNKIEHPKIKIIHTVNQGLASARNNGIREARGEFILPLDSDDTIEPAYIEKARKIMNSDASIGITYCRARLFGGKNKIWIPPEYSLKTILFKNVIFCCALFRRDDWIKSKGYNANMRHGWEDWDLWLSIISMGKKVRCIPEILFNYRIAKKSMVHAMTDQQKVVMRAQLFINHKEFFVAHLEEFFEEIYRMERSLFDRLTDKASHPFRALKLFKHRFNLP